VCNPPPLATTALGKRECSEEAARLRLRRVLEVEVRKQCGEKTQSFSERLSALTRAATPK